MLLQAWYHDQSSKVRKAAGGILAQRSDTPQSTLNDLKKAAKLEFRRKERALAMALQEGLLPEAEAVEGDQSPGVGNEGGDLSGGLSPESKAVDVKEPRIDNLEVERLGEM